MRRDDTDICASCGHRRGDHSYNGACYGLCGEFVEDQPCYCSFCGRTNREAEVMLAGPCAAFICDQCVEDAVATIVRKRAEQKLEIDVTRCALCQPERLHSVPSA